VPAEAIAATPKKNPFPECTEGLFSDDFGMQMAGKKRAPRDGLRFSPTLYMRDKLRHSYYNHNAVATWMKQAEEPVRINNLPKKIDFRRKEAPSSRNDQYEEFLSKGYRFFSKMPKKLLFILEKDLFQKVSVPVFQEFVSYVKYFRELIIKDPEMILSSFFIVCKFMCLGSYAIKNTWTEDNLSSKVRIEVDRVFEQFEKILPNKIFLEWKYLLFMETVRTMELKYFSDRELKSENLELEQPS